MLDLVDLEYYCYDSVSNASLCWREWIQSKDTQQRKKKQTDKNAEEKDKVKHSRIIWMLSRVRSTMKQKCLRKSDETNESRNENFFDRDVNQSSEEVSYEYPIPVLPKDDLRILQGSHYIPCGTFTEIRQVQIPHCPATLKRGKHEVPPINSNILRREIAVLTKIHHPNILLLMGVVKLHDSDIVSVFEDASMGTLHHLLHFKKTVLPSVELQKFMVQLCQVVLFLHDRGWLHTAISSHTIVISGNFTLKLTGFEMACQSQEDQAFYPTNKNFKRQWFQWESPEQLKLRHSPNPKMDIFSVGLIFWEMCTNAEPWRGYTCDEISKKYESLTCALSPKGLNLLIVPIECDMYVTCMQQMLQIDPEERTSSFLHILAQIHNLQSIKKCASVSDYEQPIYSAGTMKRAQVIFKPQPQRAMLSSSMQKNLHDRDPYTGLKRVSDCRRRFSEQINGYTPERKSHSTVCLDEESSPFSQFSSSSNDRKLLFLHENRNTYDRKEKVKYPFVQHTGLRSNKKEENTHTNNLKCPSILHQKTKDVNESLIRKRSISSNNALHAPIDTDDMNRSNPIKPASHHNQKTLTCGRFSSNLSFEERNRQYRNSSDRKDSHHNRDKFTWCQSVSSNFHHNTGISEIEKGHEQRRNNTSHTIISKPLLTSFRENHIQYSPVSHKNQKSNIDKNVNKSLFLSNKEKFENKDKNREHKSGDCDYHRISELLLNSQNVLKESEFESTDSGIFTSKETESEINKTDSTEDLYIDDEFCLDMELDSHMQLLCLFDSSCYDEHSSDIIHDISFDSSA